jgi:plastocyanin
MCHLFVRRKLRQAFRDINTGRYDSIVNQFAVDDRHVMHGRHAMTSLARSFILPFSIFVVAAAGIAACDGDDAKPQPAPSPAATDVADNATPQSEIVVTDAPPGPATFTVIAGKWEGAMDIEAFMPADVRIRAGDTIEWRAHGFESHTISFGDDDDLLASLGDYLVPDPANPSQKLFSPKISLRSEAQGTHRGDGQLITSGWIGVPTEASYRLTFTKEGLYTYLCFVHPFTMTGTVSVDAAGATVESPETVAARGQADLRRYIEIEKAALADAQARERTSPGPGGATIHRVQVGLTTEYGQVAVYVPASLDIDAGDTVIFENDDRDFHNVIFKGDRAEPPPGIAIAADPGGRGLIFGLDAASATIVDPPAGGFDDRTFLSSGTMGVIQPRMTWTLRFGTPGRYVYNCTIHTLAGMAGVINVR